MTYVTSRSLVLSLAAGAVALGLSACDDDDRSTTATPAAPATTATPAAPVEGAAPKPYVARSGYSYAARETRSMQDDDDMNPAFLWVDRGQDAWIRVEGEAGKSCQSCHGEVANLKGAATAYPKWNDGLKKPINIEQRINLCRTAGMKAPEWAYESDPLLAMTALVRLQSRGMPVQVSIDGPMAAWYERGRALFMGRRGQLDFACKHCHDDHAGEKMRSDTLSQGQTNGFPTYRLKWQTLGSSHRRFKGCMDDLRAESYPLGADEYVAMELFLADRGKGLLIESPSVRK